MSSESDVPVLIGVIGGSGLYHLDNLTFVKTVNPETPWGFPSAPITITSLPSGVHVAFLARHGVGHTISPTYVPSRANIAALKSIGVKVILAFSAVGSLREEISPGSFILPSQIIDRTKGIRPASFFDGLSVVAHASFGEPFSLGFTKWLATKVQSALDTLEKTEGRKVSLFTDKTTVCMEGPQFSTRAESVMYRQWGGDLINMSALPEAKLAKEAEISYGLISMATDYDSWRPHNESVTVAEVVKTMSTNAETARFVVKTVIDDLYDAITNAGATSEGFALEEVGTMKFAIMPKSEKQDPAHRKLLAYVLPEYFGEEQT